MSHLINFRIAAITALTMLGFAVGGVSYAYWTDGGGTVSSGNFTTAPSVPTPNLSCGVGQIDGVTAGKNHVATWSMPAGYQATSYRVWMTYSVQGNWQANAGNPVATIWAANNSSGTWYWPTPQNGGSAAIVDPLGLSTLTTDTSAAWGMTYTGTGIYAAQNNSGTLYVAARIGLWESAPAQATWHINFPGTLISIGGSGGGTPHVDCTSPNGGTISN